MLAITNADAGDLTWNLKIYRRSTSVTVPNDHSSRSLFQRFTVHPLPLWRKIPHHPFGVFAWVRQDDFGGRLHYF